MKLSEYLKKNNVTYTAYRMSQMTGRPEMTWGRWLKTDVSKLSLKAAEDVAVIVNKSKIEVLMDFEKEKPAP